MILQIESFLREKENIFNKLYDLQIEFEEREQDVTELQREEVEKLRELFRTRTKMTWNVVMTQEITLVSQTEQVITFWLFFTLIGSFFKYKFSFQKMNWNAVMTREIPLVSERE